MCQSVPIKYVPRHREYIELAKKESLKSKLCHRHGAVLVYRNKVLSVGYNYMRHNTFKNDNLIYSMHAEVAAVREFIRLAPRMGIKKNIKSILKDCTLYVVRTGTESMNYPLKMSKPCKNCMSFIKKHNIKKVYWSIDMYEE